MLDKSVFAMIDEEAKKQRKIENYLIFMAQCAGVTNKDDIGLLSGLKSLASQRNASEEEISSDIVKIGVMQDLLTAWFADKLDVSVFSKCKNSEQVFEVAANMQTRVNNVDDVETGLPSNWEQQSFVLQEQGIVPMYNTIYYKDGMLTHSDEIVRPSGKNIVFAHICTPQDYDDLLHSGLSEYMKKCLITLPILSKEICPLIVGIARGCTEFAEVKIGKSKIKVLLSSAMSLKGKFTKDQEKLYKKLDLSNIRYGSKVFVDKESGLPVRVFIVGEAA